MSDDFIVNRTFDEIRVGDSASLVRTLTGQDLRLFAAVSDDVNPTHLDENYARHFHSGRLVGHSLWSGALISGVLGTKLPGPGTVYESQDLRFLRPVRVGDTVTATVTARAKQADGRTVEFDCRCVNQHGEAVATGAAVVCAPAEHLRLPWPEPLEVAVQEHSKYEALLERCRKLSPARAAVAHPCDETSLAAAVEAAEAGLIEPVLVGPPARIAEVAARHGFDITRFRVVEAPDDRQAAATAVELVRKGEAEMLIKGALHTDLLMHEVVQPQTGLRTERRLSYAYIMDVPTYHKALVLTDCAINIYPTLEDKVSICQNAIDLAHTLGGSPCPRSPSSRRSRRSIRRSRPRWRPPPCARWPTAARSPAASSTGRLRRTTRSARPPRRSSISGPWSPATPMSSWCPTWRPATCWPSS